MLTLHAAGGTAMLSGGGRGRGVVGASSLLLGVTVLTSLDAGDLAGPGWLRLRRPGTAVGEAGRGGGPGRAGLLALEIAGLRRDLGPAPKIVVPGIRPAGGDDQKRVMGPARALTPGADILVIGRPITRAAARPRPRPPSPGSCSWPPPEMAPRVKICGLNEPARVAQAGSLAPLIWASCSIRPPALRRPGAGARAGGRRRPRARRPVGWWWTPTDAALEAVLRRSPLDALQLHGEETPARVAEIGRASAAG